jgi:hypothetical protein
LVKTGLIQAVSDCLGSLEHLEYTLVKANEVQNGSSNTAGSNKDAAAAAAEMLASGRAAGLGAGLGAGMGAGVLGPNSMPVTGAAMVGVTGLAVL